MKEIELSRIIIDEEKREQLIVLKEKEGRRMVPMVIGINEANAIRLNINGFLPPRPLTHDLVCSIFSELDIRLDKVVISDLTEGTFYAKLHLTAISAKGNPHIIDARPSDSIALAVRLKSPIFIEEAVFDKLAFDKNNF